MKKEKHWFKRLPKVYQEIVMEAYIKQYPDEDISKTTSLARAFIWSNDVNGMSCYDSIAFFEALHCSLVNKNNWL